MAYAAVIGFMKNVNRLKDPNIYPDQNEACEALRHSLAIGALEPLEQILQELDTKNNQTFDTAVINGVDAEIREAVWRVEDAVESYALHHSLRPSNCEDACNHHKLMKEEIRHFHRTAKVLEEKFRTLLSNPLQAAAEDEDVSPIPSKPAASISLSDQFDKILSLFMDPDYQFKTVTLVGMAGIGKTHLAREVYQHLAGVRRFDAMAWVRVGQKRTVKNIIVDVLAQTERKPRKLYVNKSLFALAMLLSKSLNGRRCFVVLDDVWSINVILRLQDAGVKRVLLTTRLGKANEHHEDTNHQMRFMSSEESWNLLWQNVFVDEPNFPVELEKVGRKIAQNCEGLPLLILAVAEILRGDDKTEEHWNEVESQKNTTFTDAYEKISQVLLSSYDYLPQHLKPCFLYMGVFPQTSEIPLPKLIYLFTVEDFAKSTQSIADFVIESLEKLVSDSLVIACKQRYDSRIKSCKLHSAYWYASVKVARGNQFFHVLKKMSDGSRDHVQGQRRLCIQNNMLFGIKEVHSSIATASTVRSMLCTGKDHEYPVPICFNLTLLKVLDAVAIRLYAFPIEAVKLLLLRYLALTHHGKVPSSISSLQHLQFLIISQHHNVELLGHLTSLPKEIWGMQQLKHLQIKGHDLPDPSHGSELHNLSTLHVNARSCTKAVFSSIPNLKKLRIEIRLQPDATQTGMSFFEHVGILNELESLKCVVVNPGRRPPLVPLWNLPEILKKLSVKGLGYPWKSAGAFGDLRRLQELKLRCSAFQGQKWKVYSCEPVTTRILNSCYLKILIWWTGTSFRITASPFCAA